MHSTKGKNSGSKCTSSSSHRSFCWEVWWSVPTFPFPSLQDCFAPKEDGMDRRQTKMQKASQLRKKGDRQNTSWACEMDCISFVTLSFLNFGQNPLQEMSMMMADYLCKHWGKWQSMQELKLLAVRCICSGNTRNAHHTAMIYSVGNHCQYHSKQRLRSCSIQAILNLTNYMK